jgi:hypothetical protein
MLPAGFELTNPASERRIKQLLNNILFSSIGGSTCGIRLLKMNNVAIKGFTQYVGTACGYVGDTRGT